MWPFSKKLEDVIFETKKVSVKGVKFIIKKIDPLTYMNGSKVMLQEFDIYKLKNSESNSNPNLEKIKEHYRDVLLAGIVSPKIVRKKEESGQFVDDLFSDMELSMGLYSEIIAYTYGKKKLKRLA